MKQRISLYFTIFFFFFFIFFIEKIVFIFTCYPSGIGFSIQDILMVLLHGLLQDLSVSAYLTIIPTLLLLGSLWVRSDAITKVMNIYFGIVVTLISIVAVADVTLYPNWGFHFDSELLMMLRKPNELFAGVSLMGLGISLLAVIFLSILLFYMYRWIIKRKVLKLRLPFSMGKSFFMLLLLLGLLYFPIRGNIFAPMPDIEQAYFSNEQFLNHAAVNPHLNFVYSFFNRKDDLKSQYQFYSKEEAENIFNKLTYASQDDNLIKALKIERPNIVLIVLDGISAKVASDSIVAPNLHKYGKEGLKFSNFYATGTDADGGIVSILSGYQVQPIASILDYPGKLRTLSSIPRVLKNESYNVSFYTNGKIENSALKSYLTDVCAVSQMYVEGDSLKRDADRKREGNYLIDRVYCDLTKKIINGSQMAIIYDFISDKSKDGFDKKFEDPYLNTVAYADSCLGNFIDSLNTSETWDNTLIIFTSNQASNASRQNLRKNEAQRFHIPMIWIGGALDKNNIANSDYASQNDLAATLLSQLNIENKEFKFSKNILSDKTYKFAFYTYKNGFSMLADTTSVAIYDIDENRMLEQKGNPDVEKQAKAYFQNMYIDLGTR